MRIRLVIADVDGTLVTPAKTLTPRTREAVARLREQGVLFALTSGRPPRGLAKLVGPLGITAPLAAFNGGVYVKPDLTTVIAERSLGPDVARAAVDYLLSERLDVWVYQGAEWYLRDPDAYHVARESRNVGFAPTVISDLHSVLQGAIKIVGVSEDLPRVARCEAELAARIGSEAFAARSQPYYLDVTHPEANKGMVVREASRMMRIPLEQIATIGDMLNDLPMLNVAGLGIAMGNAPPDVQRQARHVTRPNEEDGFAEAMDAFVLGQPPLASTALGLPPRVRACVFGLEGVLTQTAEPQARAWKQLFDPHLRERAQAAGLPYVPFDRVHDFARHFDRRSPLDGVRSFLDSRGVTVPPNTLRALVARARELLTEQLRGGGVESYEGSVRFLRAARPAGLRTAVVAQARYCEEALRAANLLELIDARINGDEGKATSELYLAGAQALGVEPEEVAVFEDEADGIAACRAAHFAYLVGVDRGGQAAELRRRGADEVVSDLSALLDPNAAEAFEESAAPL